MTKTNRVNVLLMSLLLSFPLLAQNLDKTEEEHANRVNAACDLRMKFDLHDFEYGRDERSVFSNLHYEDTSLLAHNLVEACKLNPENRKKLERVNSVIVKRGSLEERKLIQKKNGDLVYLSSRTIADRSKSRDDLVQGDLIRVLGLSFEKPVDVAKIASQKKALEEKKKSEELRAKTTSDRDKKIADLTVWFQGEIKKSQTLPPDQIGPAMEKLSNLYKEKLNAIINNP